MPELPEVETIRRGLDQGIVGQTFSAVEILWPKSFDVPPDIIAQVVVGATVSSLERRGKVLIINLSNEFSLLIHLKMTGQMVLEQANGQRFAGGHPTASMQRALPDTSTRVIFIFDSGDRVFFNDFRKFGWVRLVPTAEVMADQLISRLGAEPLSQEFTVANFTAALGRHTRLQIKPAILDQSTVSGIGNIYADESLHLARIHPATAVGSLTRSEISRLHLAIRTVIALGIEHGGTSFTSYINALGGKGDYLGQARVFRRNDQPCAVCGQMIVKIRVAGRGTHYCPGCQKLAVDKTRIKKAPLD